MKFPFRSRSSAGDDDPYDDEPYGDDPYGDDPYGDESYGHAPRLARYAGPGDPDPRLVESQRRAESHRRAERQRRAEERQRAAEAQGGPQRQRAGQPQQQGQPQRPPQRRGEQPPADPLQRGQGRPRGGGRPAPPRPSAPPPPPPPAGTGPQQRIGTAAGVPAPRHRAKILPSTGNLPPLPDEDETFLDASERLRTEAMSEQRTAWAYLALLGGLFSLIVLTGYAFDDERATAPTGGQTGEEAPAGEPSRLVLEVDFDVVTLVGTVPSEEAKAQLLAVAQTQYGVGNVVDELLVDSSVSLDGGTVRSSGFAAVGDARPEGVMETISSDFGLVNRGFEVSFADDELTPVNAEVAVAGDQAVLVGTLPDEQSVTDLVSVATEVWGAENVDVSGLTVGPTMWADGRIRITGTASPSDQSVIDFQTLAPQRLGALIVVDTSELGAGDSPELVADAQSRVDQLMTGSPIQFGPDSPEIESGSDAVVAEVAAILNEVTVPVEVVGHTDDVGPEEDNQVLSEERAQAVVDRLVELGVDVARLSSRGEGESNPIADNGTDEGKAANRRIEFLIG